MGLLSSVIVKYTQKTQTIEPFLVIVIAYIAYVLAETFHWSGIISLLGCGIAQKHYAFRNISAASSSTIKHSIKTLATLADCVIFLTLGAITISRPEEMQWHWGFVIWTCVLCLVVRFMGVFLLSFFINCIRIRKISIKEQIVIGYGGLRGAVGFSLAFIWYQDMETPLVRIFLTTMLFMVYFTVFLQGGTIKLLVNKLKIDKEEEKVDFISDDIHQKTIDLLMSGVDGILGGHHYYNIFLKHIKLFDEKYLKLWFLRNDVLNSITIHLNEISMEEHYARLYGPTVLAHEQNLGCILKPIDAYRYGQQARNNSKDGKTSQNLDVTRRHVDQGLNEDKSKFQNIAMNRIVLKDAFANTLYESAKLSKHSNVQKIGYLDTRIDSDNAYEKTLMEMKEKTRAIQNTIFLRENEDKAKISQQGDNIIQTSGIHETDKDETINIKQVYQRMKKSFYLLPEN